MFSFYYDRLPGILSGICFDILFDICWHLFRIYAGNLFDILSCMCGDIVFAIWSGAYSEKLVCILLACNLTFLFVMCLCPFPPCLIWRSRKCSGPWHRFSDRIALCLAIICSRENIIRIGTGCDIRIRQCTQWRPAGGCRKGRKGKERKGMEGKGRKEEEEQGGAASFCSKSRDPLTRWRESRNNYLE